MLVSILGSSTGPVHAEAGVQHRPHSTNLRAPQRGGNTHCIRPFTKRVGVVENTCGIQAMCKQSGSNPDGVHQLITGGEDDQI